MQRVSALTIRSCRRRRQRAMFPDTFVAGAAHLNRYASMTLVIQRTREEIPEVRDI